MSNEAYDFSGWATKAGLVCNDGLVINPNAFKISHGEQVPLVWSHRGNDGPDKILGHAFLENRNEGVYARCKFNDTEAGRTAKMLVQHGDINALSVCANGIKKVGNNVTHGIIREVSLVLAGANPGAYIDQVSIAHGDDSEFDAIIYSGIELELQHSAEGGKETMAETGKTIEEIIETMNEEQKKALYTVVGSVLDEADLDDEEEDDEEEETVKHNLFEAAADAADTEELYHGAQMEIIGMAKSPSVGSLRDAMKLYADENEINHSAFSDMSALFPEYELIDPKEPKILYDDDSWVTSVLSGVHKSVMPRVRTRRADARKKEIEAELKAKGYRKGTEKKLMDQIKLLGRTHDPETVYIKEALHRDDILDITDFDVVRYHWDIMRHTMNQTLAEAILIGDGRSDIDPDKIREDHIRPIWHDDDLYCIHYPVDIEGTKNELQGTNTGANFGESFIYTESIIKAALYSREQYKGSGNPTYYCTPHVLNMMLLARDLNGRRIYSSKNELIAAMNVKDIVTVEQFEGLTRVRADGKTVKLLGLMVNLKDYQVGCVRKGEITTFDQFDIDFNVQKLLMETRLSGALTEWYSAIALEQEVSAPTSRPTEDPEARG